MIIIPCTPQDVTTILDGINNYNLSQVPGLTNTFKQLEFVAKNTNDEVVGGILCSMGYWAGLEIKVLWVKEAYRNSGIGSRLLKHAEDTAVKNGATIAMLDTFDFQAEGFYLKNGYTPFGEINDFPKGHRRIYFSKKLA